MPHVSVAFWDPQVDQALCDLLRHLSRNGLERVLAVAISGTALMGDGAWRLLRSGASDVFAWDHSDNPASEIAARFERWEAVDDILGSDLVGDNLIGRNPVWISVLRQTIEVANFTDASIMVCGESGTGKELVARLIHTLDARRKNHDLVILDCTTIVPELSGSEFFGHERGAFTGAVISRDGAFALADGGTLFLDEVGDLPLALQAELLRVVQERTYKRVGPGPKLPLMPPWHWQKVETSRTLPSRRQDACCQRPRKRLTRCRSSRRWLPARISKKPHCPRSAIASWGKIEAQAGPSLSSLRASKPYF